MMQYQVQQSDRHSKGRVGLLTTGHAEVETPAFMPVGSLGPVKGLEPEDLQSLGFRLILNNAYHLYLRPGHKIVADMGGLHAFTGWPGAILTDSGGFQIFSLAKLCEITDEGVTFQSHIDGSTHFLTPEKAIEIEEALGADIIMALDQCVALVGEGKPDMYAMLDVTVPELPESKPRYLMGVGHPEDLLEGVARGIDLFDCVVPSRHGRTGSLFTRTGRVVIKQARYAEDERPIDPDCTCPVCRRYSRAYLHHLFIVKEMLGARLNTIHNLWYFSELMRQIREALREGTFPEFRDAFYRNHPRQAVMAGLAECEEPC
ncbi:MAG: tRNA-guanine transglycosylase [Nitrospirae bacterium]|nr:tRNA-guanine transglycosylase [Nitrospirota bacterium]